MDAPPAPPFDYTVPVDPDVGPVIALQVGYPYVADPRLLRMVPHLLKKQAERDGKAAGGRRRRSDPEFCFAFSFAPNWIDAVARQGLFPMSLDFGVPVFGIKCHNARCAMPIADLHVSRSVRKAARRFEFSVNAAFETVMAMCVKQHGENWLFPQIRHAFLEMHRRPADHATKLYSFEVWLDGKLVAGELGYLVGKLYTSLTGARTVDKSGSVQLLAMGRLLQQVGVTVIDFGMAMDYKLALGAKEVPRDEWLKMAVEHNSADPGGEVDAKLRRVLGGRRVNCRTIIDGVGVEEEVGVEAQPEGVTAPVGAGAGAGAAI